MSPHPIVLLVDDDAAVRASLGFWLDLEGLLLVAFDRAEALLASGIIDTADCLVIDERLPGMTGLQLLAELRRQGVAAPAIITTSHATRALRDAARAAGAQLVEKPLIGDALLAQIRTQLGSFERAA